MKTILGTMTFSDQVDRDNSAAMIGAFREAGHVELDSAFAYNEGKTETLLGELRQDGVLDQCSIATKVNPWNDEGLSPDSVDHQFSTSLSRMQCSQVDLLYLHAPDLDTPIEDTLAAIHRYREQNRFLRFGLSNYAAWQVAEIMELCRKNGWMQPTVYQGMYNALTRDVEKELFACLTNYDIGFYVYNPLAGGLLSGKHLSFEGKPMEGRFASNDQYLDRYWKADYFSVINRWAEVCKKDGIAPAAAAIRWLRHHSDLASTDIENGGSQSHGLILGASSISHLQQNLDACKQDALPQAIVDALDEGWETVRPSCIKYFRP